MGTKILTSVEDLRKEATRIRALGLSIGLVPTMGALHEGHQELLKRSKVENDVTILSIFVNPTQFNNPEDFNKYPKTLERDFDIATTQHVDLVFCPESKEELYPDDYRYRVTELEFSKKLCGAYRPGHFDGVLTIVLKLLNLTQCQRAYFGEKDFQQLQLIQGMVTALFLPLTIVAVPTVRNSNGLALSSRNQRLSPKGQEQAAQVYSILNAPTDLASCREKIKLLGFEVEYLEEHFGRRFIAYFIEGVRLIDNVLI